MLRFIPLVCILITTQVTKGQTGFIIDHDDVALFDHIPETYLEAARKTRMLFSDRSVGQNVHDALNYLAYPSWAQTPASARRDYTDLEWHWKTFNQNDWNAGLVPDRIRFTPDPIRYDRSNWTFVLKSGSWKELTQDFIQTLGPAFADSVDVWSFQFSYLNVTEGETIADPQTGFFSDQAGSYDIYDLESFLAQYPDNQFVYWTASLARGIGTSVSTSFNDQLRTWCVDNNRILFDFADILSHTDQGEPCFDNRDGIPYVSQTGQMEDHPDDGADYPAICQDYTTETDGGHLGSVSAGSIRIVKALWVLMARVAGWDGKMTAVYEPLHAPRNLIHFPNPVSMTGTLTIQPEHSSPSGLVEIMDLFGHIVHSQRITTSGAPVAIKLSGQFPPGTYCIRWSDQKRPQFGLLTVY